jgi:threonylcarbamoyladenosine tRNA methylthiotransferase MtaB
MPPFSFAVGFLGCRANEVEADALRSDLLAAGGREAGRGEPADVTVLNTCAVTGSAQAQSRNGVRRAHRVTPLGLVVVTGCAAQLDPLGFAGLPGVDLVVGNRDKARLGSVLRRLAGQGALGWPPGPEREGALTRALAEAGLQHEGGRGAAGGSSPICWTADPTSAAVAGRQGPVAGRRARPSIKIQDGCSFHCAYCIVAGLRGRPVSRDSADVVAEARRLAAAGHREVVLAGINLGLHGGLAGLLAELSDVAGIERIRLSSLEPMTVTDALLDRIAELPKVARSFHLPFQSGDEEVLRRMGRPYGPADLEALVARIARRLPFFGLGVDIVAGFPGESPEAFARTLELLERLPVSYLHAFAYSERPGTPAAAFTPRVPASERKARVARLRELDGRLRVRFQQRLVGRRCWLVIERAHRGSFTGMSGEYVRMSGEARDLGPGEWVAVVAGQALEPGRQHCRVVEGA